MKPYQCKVCGREFNHSGSFSGHKKRVKECGQYYLTQREKIKENKRLNVKNVKSENTSDSGVTLAAPSGKTNEDVKTQDVEMLSNLLLVIGNDSSSASGNDTNTVRDSQISSVSSEKSVLQDHINTAALSGELNCAPGLSDGTTKDMCLVQNARSAGSEEGEASVIDPETQCGKKGAITLMSEDDYTTAKQEGGEPNNSNATVNIDGTKTNASQGDSPRKRKRTSTPKGRSPKKRERPAEKEHKKGTGTTHAKVVVYFLRQVKI